MLFDTRELTFSFAVPSCSEWRSLRARMPEPWRFLSGAWLPAWANNFLPKGRWRAPCQFATIRAGDIVTGVFPLAPIRFGPIELCALGGYFLPYRSPALDSSFMDSTCDLLVSALGRIIPLRFGLRLGPVSALNPMSNALSTALKRYNWHLGTRVLGTSFCVDLPQSFDHFKESSHSVIKRARYHQRRLERAGNVEIRRFCGLSTNEWNVVLETCAEIERNSWVSKEGGHLNFSNSATKQFWASVLSDPFLSDIISIHILYFEGRGISFSLNIDLVTTKYIIANLYDDNFKLHSCGTILAYHVVRDAIIRGQKTIDWGQGDSGYKQIWSAKPHHAVQDIIAVPPGIAGTAARTALAYAGFTFA